MPSSLGRRPQATVFSVEDLVERVRRGEVRVPKFQRRLKWRAKDVRLLFDSILRGYPVGSLLFWKRAAQSDSVKLGPLTVDAPATRDALWVVDGQQRITSLIGALLHPDPLHGRDNYALGFDLQAEDFIRSRSSLSKTWMPLNIVLDTAKLLAWLDAYPLRAERPEHIATAHRVAKALRDYQLPAYVIEESDEALVRDVFGRLNSAGRKLKADEVFDALSGSEETSSASTLQAISNSVAELGFGRFERPWILKSIQAVAGHNFTQAPASSLSRNREAHAAAERALRDVAIFLRRDAGIPHASLLPYGLPIPILAKFFHRHPSPKARSRDLLSRWLWRGSNNGDHRGESIPEVRKMLAAVELPEEEAVQMLLRQLSSSIGEYPSLLAPFAWRTADTKIEVNALLALGPRELSTGRPINVAQVLEREHTSALKRLWPHRIFANERSLRREGFTSPESTIANRFLHPGPESFVELLTKATHRPDASTLFKSHGLPEEETVRFLKADPRDNTPAAWHLLTARQELLLQTVDAFLTAKERTLETDRPSIQALIISDVEQVNG